MISEFKKKKLLFFQIAWANKIVKWISGINSPSGTIRIVNTLSPSDKTSMTIDVDVEVVARRVAEILNGENRPTVTPSTIDPDESK